MSEGLAAGGLFIAHIGSNADGSQGNEHQHGLSDIKKVNHLSDRIGSKGRDGPVRKSLKLFGILWSGRGDELLTARAQGKLTNVMGLVRLGRPESCFLAHCAEPPATVGAGSIDFNCSNVVSTPCQLTWSFFVSIAAERSA